MYDKCIIHIRPLIHVTEALISTQYTGIFRIIINLKLLFYIRVRVCCMVVDGWP